MVYSSYPGGRRGQDHRGQGHWGQGDIYILWDTLHYNMTGRCVYRINIDPGKPWGNIWCAMNE